MHASRFALLPALLLAMACEAGGGTDEAVVTDSSGVRLVRNGRTGSWGAAPLSLTEVRRIGVVDGDEKLQFHQIFDLAVAEDGTIYVGNNQTATVRVFSPDGRFIREIGGKGRGPGEYTMVNKVWLAGDGVAITDWQGGGKTGIYDRDGKLLHFWTARRPEGATVFPAAKTPAGWLASHSPPYAPPALAPGEPYTRVGYLYRFDTATNDITDSLIRLPGRTLYGSPDTHGLDWALFDPQTEMRVDGRGNVYLAPGEGYRIDVYDANGRHVRGISRVHDPVPIGDDDMARLKEMISQRYEGREATEHSDPQRERERILARIDRQRALNPRPHLPVLGRLLVSHDGSFWVERADNADPATLEYERMFGMFGRAAPRPSRWDLFDADGIYLGTADVDARFTPLAVRGAEVTGVYKDEMDVEYVVTYRAAAGGE